MRKKLWKFLATILITILLITGIYYVMEPGEDDNVRTGKPSEEEIISIIYNESYLGYNSMVWYGITTPLGVPDDLELQDTSGMALPVYEYNAFELTDKTVARLMNKYFPHINIDNLDVNIINPEGTECEFLRLENETYMIELFDYGGITYYCKTDLLRTEDNIKSREAAKALALKYLKDHGGVPDDISRISSYGMTTSRPSGPHYYGSYMVHIYRDVGGFNIAGSGLRNKMTFEFDSGNSELVEFEYHWPELKFSFDIDNLVPLDQVLDFYEMNSSLKIRANITSYAIVYKIPLSLHCYAYNVTAKTFYLAPYWVVSTEDARSYYLGIVFPDAYVI